MITLEVASLQQGKGEYIKGGQLAQWGAIISTVQRAPRNLEYIYIIMETNNLCDIISIQIVL